ncbi:hypothetical protein [Limisalsivibrio acetivorans]|uniref:hypothetical protein n=1 Tax=Limisalsivibrio acetivorans TaxID=1304888 RepID=UPI0003B4FF5D|nr:hypothetical protein [Limisalsivibrio acetivorans]
MKKIIVILAVVAAAAAGAYFGAQSYFEKKVVQELNSFVQMAGVDDEVEYSSISVNPISREGLIKDVRVSDGSNFVDIKQLRFNIVDYTSTIEGIRLENLGQSILIDRINVLEYKTEGKYPQKTHITVDNFKIPLNSTPAAMKSLEMDELVMDMEIKTDSDYEEMMYEYEVFNIDVEGFTEFKSNFTFGDIDIKSYEKYSDMPPEELQNNQEFSNKISQDISNMKLYNMSISLEDTGIIEKIITERSKAEDIEFDEAREEIVEELTEIQERAASDFEKNALDSALTILKDENNRYIIDINPAQPISMQELVMLTMTNSTLGPIAEQLNMSIRAE